MSALIAAGIGAAGALGSAVLPGLFGGKGGTSSSQSGSTNQNTISGPVPGSPYEQFENRQLANIDSLSQKPFQPYDTSQMFAPMNADQWGAVSQVRGAAANSYQPYFEQANQSLRAGTGAGYDPVAAGQSAFGRAGSAPGGVQTANPYAQTASQMTPDVIQGYLNPYINNTVNASNQLQSSNFLNNVMPGLTNQFVGSGGGLGSKQYGTAMNTGLTNFNQNVGNTSQAALAQAYNASAGQAQNDLARQAGLAGTMGNLALGDINAQTNLGTAQGQNAALGSQTANNRATAWQGLGTGYLNNALTGANALMQVGNQQQQQDQLQKTADYQQFKEAQDYPFKTAGWAANTANQYQWPMRQNTSGSSTSSGSGSATSSPSPLSTGLGIAATVGGIMGGGMRDMSSYDPLGQSGDAAANNAVGQYGPVTMAAQRGGYLRKAAGGYLSLNEATMPPKARPAFIADEPMEHNFDHMNHPSMPPKAQSAFSNTYARGGLVGTYFAPGGYLGLNEASLPPKAQSAFADTYATGGRVHNRWSDRGRYPMEGRVAFMPRQNVPGDPAFGASGFATGGSVAVIKASKANTRRSLEATRKEKKLKERMARPDLPLDLSGRSGHFQ